MASHYAARRAGRLLRHQRSSCDGRPADRADFLSASSGKPGRREVDPYHLWYAAGGLYLIGYCHRRRDVRMFAVERTRSLTITDHPYRLPLGFEPAELTDAVREEALALSRH